MENGYGVEGQGFKSPDRSIGEWKTLSANPTVNGFLIQIRK